MRRRERKAENAGQPGRVGRAARRAGRRFGRYLLRVVTIVLVAAVLFTYGGEIYSFLRSLLPGTNYEQTTEMLTHEMEKVGEMTFVKYSDTGTMNAKTDALFIGTVQKVSVPFKYEIGLGFSLTDVVLEAKDTGIAVYLPEVRMLYDSFEVTGKPEVKDFWYSLSQEKYQKMLDEQAAKCRASYTESPETLTSAWLDAVDELTELFGKWSGTKLPLAFAHLEEYVPAGQTGEMTE